MAAMVAIGNEDFRDELNIVLEEFFDDGTYWAIYDRYFSEEPWSLDQMINEPPVDR
jgi:ABC-type amino acid transport substrate-binding protein